MYGTMFIANTNVATVQNFGVMSEKFNAVGTQKG